MSLSADQQAAQEKPVAREAYFIEFQFLSGTQRVCNSNITFPWNGYDWLGLGAVGAIGSVQEADSPEPRELSFTINAADPSWLALAVGSTEEYRGRAAKMYMCPLDENFKLVGAPKICWRGIMDTVVVSVDGVEAQVSLSCETSAFGLRRPTALRMSANQQKQRYPDDTGFDYVQGLIATPSEWLSKKFQSV